MIDIVPTEDVSPGGPSHIVDDMRLFRDREDAGRQLAQTLAPYQGGNSIVLALPRGGVVVAYQVARALGLPLDVVVVRKLGAPSNPEFAIGAIGPGGVRVLDEESVRLLGVSEDDLNDLDRKARAEMERRVGLFRGGLPQPEVRGRTVILVDDGIATGATARAAILALRFQGAGKIILAIPVGPRETVERLRREVDDVVCLLAPWHSFTAVGTWYDRFGQVSDAEVAEFLQRARQERGEEASESVGASPRY
jgi:putative phosphoribosyl transferase